ncbi:MAG TPA: sigma factor, partial [Gemmatimonadaceae bacterium]|nr:sigma factor [Gemmatimonadaceae bacterium]
MEERAAVSWTHTRDHLSVDWKLLYEIHAPELQRYLAKLTGEREAATELMQDVFVSAMRAPIREPA